MKDYIEVNGQNGSIHAYNKKYISDVHLSIGTETPKARIWFYMQGKGSSVDVYQSNDIEKARQMYDAFMHVLWPTEEGSDANANEG